MAEAIDLSPAYVESVASFYDRLYLRPTGTRVVSVCVTLSCMLRGSDELLEHICDREGLPERTAAPARTAPSPCRRPSAWATATARPACRWTPRRPAGP